MSTSGPLRDKAGKTTTIGTGVKGRAGRRGGLSTWSFGAGLCSADPDAKIEIDDVTYRSSPPVGEWSRETREASVGTMFRVVEPGMDGMISADHEPSRLPGVVTSLAEGPAVPITRSCDPESASYAEVPKVELLTVLAVDARGAVVDTTIIEYHVGDQPYTLRLERVVGQCGTEVPRRMGCRR